MVWFSDCSQGWIVKEAFLEELAFSLGLGRWGGFSEGGGRSVGQGDKGITRAKGRQSKVVLEGST